MAEFDAQLFEEVGAPRALAEVDRSSSLCSQAYCHVQVAHHTVTNAEKRHGNEDRWMYRMDIFQPTELNFHTVGILDGHDTDAASDRVSKLLPEVVSKHLNQGKALEEAYTEAMAECEESLKVHRVISAGTCVLSCTIAGHYVWCANLGDCRAVIVPLAVPEDIEAILAADAPTTAPKVTGLHWLSHDQKASDPKEAKRIEEAGGQVIEGRVEGLEPSRTLGDFDVKQAAGQDVISIKPEIRRFELGDGKSLAQAILICATDGVWDTTTGQDIGNLIVARKEITQLQAQIGRGDASPDCGALKDIAEDLVAFSIAKGSLDDCTAVVVMISVM